MKSNRKTRIGHNNNGGGQGQQIPRLANGGSALDQPKVDCANPDCDGKVFAGGVYIHKVSAILSASGQPEYVGETVSYCVKCHTPLPAHP